MAAHQSKKLLNSSQYFFMHLVSMTTGHHLFIGSVSTNVLPPACRAVSLSNSLFPRSNLCVMVRPSASSPEDPSVLCAEIENISASPQSMYSALPGLLDGNPFSESGQLRVPDGLDRILEVLKEALKVLTAFQVHPDISLQLCAYLFFFINASLFNALMERGTTHRSLCRVGFLMVKDISPHQTTTSQ